MSQRKKNDKRTYWIKIFLLVFLDALSVAVSYYFGLWARYDFLVRRIPIPFRESGSRFILVMIVLTIAVYWLCRMYHSIWRYASLSELYRILKSYMFIGGISFFLYYFDPIRIPRGAQLIGFVVSILLCFCLRFGYRIAVGVRSGREDARHSRRRLLIIGAGQAGQEIIKDIRGAHNREFELVGLIDDNPLKKGRYLEGVHIIGNRNDIAEIVRKEEVDLIIFAISNIDPQERRDILNLCKESGARVMTVPGLYQLYTGEVSVSLLKDVELEDLLGRSVTKVDNEKVFEMLNGKTVMVTGGGGSIGSELCRQIAKADPGKLIIFDVYENSTYDIQQELKRNFPDLDLLALIGDVSDRTRIRSVLQKYHPDIIYHAAAHKHVPLMEDSPNEAIKNNVMGTLTICEEAADAGVKRFLLISTDKAVNPTNIMGASKRLCEMIVQMMSRRSTATNYMAVRFGNVLGSNGSVVPLFKKQIAAGGPVTVTDPNIIRYFMTIPEAVSLVLQASYYAKGGEIFVLDMGRPVRIDDMARNLIKLSGLKPDVDIKIVYTGLRPGEKLYEELLMDEEGMTKTENDLIYIGHPIEMDDETFRKDLEVLKKACHEESDTIEETVERIIPTYHPDLQGNSENLKSFLRTMEPSAETGRQ